MKSFSSAGLSIVVTLDRRVGAVLDSLFFEDLRHAREVQLAEFERCPLWERLLELGATTMSRVL